MNRYLTSVYINQANTILKQIYATPKAGQISALLISADGQAAVALADYGAMNYASAASHAGDASTNPRALAASFQSAGNTTGAGVAALLAIKCPASSDTVNSSSGSSFFCTERR